jgi:chemotaxis signal transduction protein
MSWVKSILRMDRLRQRQFEDETGAAESPGFDDVDGWVTVGHENIPVFRLGKILQRSLRSTDDSDEKFMRIIVLQSAKTARGKAAGSWALLVDRVSQVLQITGEQITPLPPIMKQLQLDLFQNVIRQNTQLSLLLKPERLEPTFLQVSEKEQSATVVREIHESFDKEQIFGQEQKKSRQHGKMGSSYGRIMTFSPLTIQVEGKKISFGLSISQISEILQPLPIMPVPLSPSYLLGLVQWRKQPVPLLNLEALLGLRISAHTQVDEKNTRLLIAHGADSNTFLGIQIYADIQALKLPFAYVPSRRELAIKKDLTSAIVELEDETLIIPNIQRVLEIDSSFTVVT